MISLFDLSFLYDVYHERYQKYGVDQLDRQVLHFVFVFLVWFLQLSLQKHYINDDRLLDLQIYFVDLLGHQLHFFFELLETRLLLFFTFIIVFFVRWFGTFALFNLHFFPFRNNLFSFFFMVSIIITSYIDFPELFKSDDPNENIFFKDIIEVIFEWHLFLKHYSSIRPYIILSIH